MESLEKLKNVWQNQEESSIKFSTDDIHSMVQKKSSSIVKWILVISILEFVLPNLIYIFSDHDATVKFYENYDLVSLAKVYTTIHILIIIGFIYIFFKNYKNINTESNIKTLLQNILKTRSTVKYYIYYNLTFSGIIGIHLFYIIFNSDIFINELPQDSNMVLVWVVALFSLAFVLFVFWVFYQFIYGILLKKLTSNYSELLKNE